MKILFESEDRTCCQASSLVVSKQLKKQERYFKMKGPIGTVKLAITHFFCDAKVLHPNEREIDCDIKGDY